MNSYRTHFLHYQFPAILWAAVIFGVSSIPASKLPTMALLAYDKLIHFTIYFIFGLLTYRAFEPRVKSSSISWRRIFLAVAVVVIYGLTDEFHQGFVPGRTVDIRDASMDAFGALTSAAIIYLNWKRKNFRIRAGP